MFKCQYTYIEAKLRMYLYVCNSVIMFTSGKPRPPVANRDLSFIGIREAEPVLNLSVLNLLIC